MPVKDVYNFNEFPALPVFCFNKDLSRLALSPNNNEIHIFSFNDKKWQFESTLTEHTERVTGIDWAPNSNKILSCAADRNAYVWDEETKGQWKQSLVLLRINRAATTCRWSPTETKFAVGAGDKLISLCYYDSSNNWWVSKHIKKPIRSSILCVEWHPKGGVIAAGSSDFRLRLFNAEIADIEKDVASTTWGDKTPFGALIAEFCTSMSGWVHSVSFSPSGQRLAWVGHDSTVSVADSSSGSTPIIFYLKLNILPLLSCLFLDEESIISGGHNNRLYKFKWNGSAVENIGAVDEGNKIKDTSDAPQSAMSKFRNMDKFAQSESVESLSSKNIHANSISKIILLPNNEIATSGYDPKIVIWDKL